MPYLKVPLVVEFHAQDLVEVIVSMVEQHLPLFHPGKRLFVFVKNLFSACYNACRHPNDLVTLGQAFYRWLFIHFQALQISKSGNIRRSTSAHMA